MPAATPIAEVLGKPKGNSAERLPAGGGLDVCFLSLGALYIE